MSMPDYWLPGPMHMPVESNGQIPPVPSFGTDDDGSWDGAARSFSKAFMDGKYVQDGRTDAQLKDEAGKDPVLRSWLARHIPLWPADIDERIPAAPTNRPHVSQPAKRDPLAPKQDGKP